MTPRLLRHRPAATTTAALALAAIALGVPGPGAHASVTDAPCDTSHQLVKQELRAEVNGRDALLGKLYVFDEGRRLCAVTTSAGTLWDGVAKSMEVTLSIGGASDGDRGRFRRYAGRVRLPDTGGCFVAHGLVRLDSGADADVHASCSISRRKPMP